MFQTLIIFLPVSVCLFWMIAHTLSAYRVDTYRIVMVLLLFAGLVLFFDSCYSDNRAPMDLFMVSAIIAQFAAPCLIPMVGLYMRRLRTSERPHPFLMMWLLAPAALFTSEIVMHLLAPPGENCLNSKCRLHHRDRNGQEGTELTGAVDTGSFNDIQWE